jgi:hypothetical protein
MSEQQPHDPDLAEALEYLSGALARHPRDWSTDHRDAWLYGVLNGWACEKNHEHDGIDCSTDALDEVAAQHRWSDKDLETFKRHRAAIRRAKGERVTAD